MVIRSLYNDKPSQFEAEIIGEAESVGEPAYLCLLLPEYRDKMLEGDKPFALRKRLVDGEMYGFVQGEPKPTQLTLF